MAFPTSYKKIENKSGNTTKIKISQTGPVVIWDRYAQSPKALFVERTAVLPFGRKYRGTWEMEIKDKLEMRSEKREARKGRHNGQKVAGATLATRKKLRGRSRVLERRETTKGTIFYV